MGIFATQGSLLKVSISSVYTLVAHRTRIKPNEGTRAKIETTDLDSTAESSLPGLPRYGEVEVDLNYDPANSTHAYLYASFQSSGLTYGAGTVESWQQTMSNGSVVQFSGWISGWARGEQSTDKVQMVTVKIQVTGVETLTP